MSELDELKQELKEVYGLVRESATVHGANNVMLKNIADDLKESNQRFETLRAVITGNGHPEEGFTFRLKQVEKNQSECPIIKVASDVAEIKTALKINEAKQPTIKRLVTWAKQHPKSAVAWIALVCGGLGLSADKVIKIAERVLSLLAG